ncbi:hypothetical protein O988_01778 [Pseudogymnoascus sp. VKM F-3808]|nr:hypothetical protein O988_01778 [Pseudogymnoascus sp. VKM F-3808]
MFVPPTTVETISKCFTLVDYVQFQKWEKTDCFSETEQFQVSASYAMGIVFNFTDGGYKREKPLQIAPSFFRTDDRVRLGCYNYGHGIVYEGRWVTYDDKIMCGSSDRELQAGQSFAILCTERGFRKWFAKVLNGDYKEYDFDTLPRDVLISLTSPNSPGSLASDNPAGSNPSAGLSIPGNQTAARAQQGAARSKSNAPLTSGKKLASGLSRLIELYGPLEHDELGAEVATTPSTQIAAPARQRVAVSTSVESTNSQGTAKSKLKLPPAVDKKATGSRSPRLGWFTKVKFPSPSSTQDEVRAYRGAREKVTSTRSNLAVEKKASATREEENTTLGQDGSQSAGHATEKPLSATPPLNKAAASTKRRDASPLTDSLKKRTKTTPSYQRQDVIDLSSDNDEQVKRNPDNSQSAHNATQDNKHDQSDPGLLEQNQRLSEENASLKLSESRVVNKLTEALGKIEKLTQDNTSLKLSEMRAVNRANEALGKLRAANRANEELGGNDDLMGQMEELLKENARLQVRLAERGDQAVGVDKDVAGRVKNEGSAQRVKEEGQTGQREK